MADQDGPKRVVTIPAEREPEPPREPMASGGPPIESSPVQARTKARSGGWGVGGAILAVTTVLVLALVLTGIGTIFLWLPIAVVGIVGFLFWALSGRG